MMAMREKILKSRIYRLVLLLMLFSMAGGGIVSLVFSTFFRKRSMLPTIAAVNDVDITYKNYDYRRAQETERLAFLRQQYGGQALDVVLQGLGLADPNATALKSLIGEELLNQASQKLGLHVSQELITQKLSDPVFLMRELRDLVPFQVLDQRGTINMAALTEVLKQRGLTFADFENSLEQALQRKMLSEIVDASAYVSLDEAKDYFAMNFSKAQYTILRLPFEVYLKKVSAKPLSNEMLEKFFNEENKATKRYWIPERRSGMLWKFKPESYHLKVNDADIENYYQEHKRSSFMKSPLEINVRRILFNPKSGADAQTVQEKALKVKEQLDQNPQDFEKLAKEYSDDKTTASKGGSVGYFKRGDRDPAFEKAAFRLKNDGEISPIIKTAEGLEIVQRVGRKAAAYKSLQEVTPEIQKILLLKKFKTRFSEEAQRMVDRAPEDTQAMQDFIAKQNAEKQSFDVTFDASKSEESENSGSETSRSKKIFKTKQGAWNFLFDKDGTGTILFVEKIEKKHEPSLQLVRKAVEQDFYRQQAQHALDADLKVIADKGTTERLQTFKEPYQAELVALDWIKKEDKERIQALRAKGIPVEKLLFVPGKKALEVAYGKEDGFMAKRDALEPYDEALFNDKKAEIMKELLQEKKELAQRGFLASLYKNATIKISEDQGNNRPVPLDDMGF